MSGERSEDFIDLYDLFTRLWLRKYWILAGVAAGMTGGAIYAVTRPPQYQALAVISSNAPRSAVSQLVSASLPDAVGGGGAGISLLEIRLTSRSISEKVGDLEPGIASVLFPAAWNAAARKWKGAAPSREAIGARLRTQHLAVVSSPRQGVLNVTVTLPDSAYSKRIADAYLQALKLDIQENTLRELEDGNRFLEKQAATATDPVVLGMIRETEARNVERATFNNPADFQVIEYPAYPLGRNGSQTVRLTFLWGVVAGGTGMLIVFAHYMASAMLDERRRRLNAQA